MKICRVIATDPQGDKQVFSFGTATDGKAIDTTRGGKLNSYLEFCFKEQSENVKDVEVEFFAGEDEFSLARLHNEDGTTRTVLKKRVDGHWQVVARTKAVQYIEQILNEQLVDMLRMDYVNNIAVDNFHGNLFGFDQIKMLVDVQQSVKESSAQAKALQQNAMDKVRAYSGTPTGVSAEQIDQINDELANVSQQIAVATAELGELKSKQVAFALSQDIANDLDVAQQKYNQLIARQDEIQIMRDQLQLRDQAITFLPKIRTLNALTEQRKENEKRRYQITLDIESVQAELDNVVQQLAEKQNQFTLVQDRRARIEAINNELQYIASLYEKNKTLNEQLISLSEKQQRLIGEKTVCANKLRTIEQNIAEIKQNLDGFDLPAKSVGELLETVRVDVKIDEVTAQIEKLQGEIAVKESQIAERENSLVGQVKRFRSVAEIDVAVTPIKAKDTILQVLDSKYGKLEAINQSLQEKLRNLERALEDYKYRIMQLEQAKSNLEMQREKALLRKQEEFKREVFLNSQKVYSDDASSVFAVTVSFNDAEIEQMDQEIQGYSMDRDLLYERAYQLEGSIKEIKRHIEINSAEMETLSKEKTNIINRYNEIVTQNNSEAAFNYIKALNSNNGTKYLLDVQQDAVRSETELAELKRYTEALKGKLASLRSRLTYLRETQIQLDDSKTSIDMLVSTNDKIKDELTDIGGRLSAAYEQYKSVSRQMETIESRLTDVRADIVEVTRTIKVNEQQIAEANDRAKRYAGGDDIEKAIANFRYELGDVESEKQMLADAKQSLEKDLFKKRLELEKAQWLYDTKNTEYAELYQELQLELKLKGSEIDKVVAIDDDGRYDDIRRVLGEYDSTKASLLEKIDNLYSILKDKPLDYVSPAQVEQKANDIALLQARQTQLETLRNKQMEVYVAASSARIRATAAAAEARAISTLSKTIEQNSLIGLLIKDKINAILTTASNYLKAFTGKLCTITHTDGIVSVSVDGNKVAYDDLERDIKVCTYVAIILAMPSTDATDGRWLIFEERINADKNTLANMMFAVDNVSYVVDVDDIKA